MAFIDELTLKIKAGNGGDGVARWRREKFKEFGGPAGGNGGKGGDVYVTASANLHGLEKYAHVTELEAKNGALGENYSKTGKDGDDLELIFPVGTVLTNTSTGESFELLSEDSRYCILKGGDGGYGNEYFKSSTNQRPKEWTAGERGERATFQIELKLVADIGLIGLPSAGKSSLLNALTNATAKTGAYHFTTLEPNLGVLDNYIIADIPGLISGAHSGKGLGHTFLRHITRTRVLAHLISFEYAKEKGGEGMQSAYTIIREELAAYSSTLAEKPECIILSKSDMVDSELAEQKRKEFLKFKVPVFLLSVYDEDRIQDTRDGLLSFLKETQQEV